MQNKKIAWFLLVCSVILLLINSYRIYYEGSDNYFGIVSNILLIVAMLISIYQKKI